jgi:pimeloyl-ACP methyl ester carboxylesterase
MLGRSRNLLDRSRCGPRTSASIRVVSSRGDRCHPPTQSEATTDKPGRIRDREVILFNNAGVSSSSGEVPTTFEQMAANAVAFTRALGVNKTDVLGFSIGGMVAQEIVLQAPDLVRKLILVGTGPRGGQGMESLTQAAGRLFGAAYDPPEYVWLAVQFSPSEAGQAAGRAFLKRTHLRQEGRDPTPITARSTSTRSSSWNTRRCS